MREWLDGLPDQRRDMLRVLGGVALLAAALALFIRKASHDEWGAFGRLLVLGVPCVALLALSLGWAEPERQPLPPVDRGLLIRARRLAPGWQSVLAIAGLILVPFVLFQFLDAIGGSTDDSLNAAWIFAVTAAVGFYLSFATGVTYGTLLGALSVVVAWLAFWDKATSPSLSSDRWLLIIIAAALVVAALQLDREDLRQGADLVTAAGIAAVGAGILGLIGAAFGFLGQSISRAFGGLGGATPVGGVRQHQEWDIFLLVIALLLIWYGNRRAARGPTYVGALALGAFTISVGIELTRLFAGKGPPTGAFVGWPLLLVAVAGAALVAGFWPQPPLVEEVPAALPEEPPSAPPAGPPPAV